NPGALRQQGITLPLELRIQGSTGSTAAGGTAAASGAEAPPLRRIEGMLKQAGLVTSGSPAEGAAPTGEAPTPGFVLSLRFEEFAGAAGPGWIVLCELRDQETQNTVLSRDFLLASASRRDTAAFARELADAVFVRNGLT
ncbi:MAG: hypothetical protein LBU21_08730, partial [Treponema sp.]|nr:hypothetical protein [Treponema sp.]